VKNMVGHLSYCPGSLKKVHHMPPG
jgi:hypothetical protein